MNEYYCPKCGHIVIARDRPAPIRWTDGHVCVFVLTELSDKLEKMTDEAHKRSG